MKRARRCTRASLMRILEEARYKSMQVCYVRRRGRLMMRRKGEHMRVRGGETKRRDAFQTPRTANGVLSP